MLALRHLLLPMLLATHPSPAPLEHGALLPPVIGERLDGHASELPAAVRGHVTLVAFGFTRGSAKAVQAYGERFKRSFAADSAYDWVEVPLMGGMARFMRSFITGAMRGGTPEPDRRHVLTVWTGASDWKPRLGYREGKWAYLVLLDRDGRVRWRGAGTFDDAIWRELDAAVTTAR